MNNANLAPALLQIEQAISTQQLTDVNTAMHLFFSLVNTLLAGGVGQLNLGGSGTVINTSCPRNKHVFLAQLIQQSATDAGWLTSSGVLNPGHLLSGDAATFSNQINGSPVGTAYITGPGR